MSRLGPTSCQRLCRTCTSSSNHALRQDSITMKYKLLGRSGLRVSELVPGLCHVRHELGHDRLRQAKRAAASSTPSSKPAATSSTPRTATRKASRRSSSASSCRRDRDRFVVATKYSLFDGHADGNDPNACGNHRKNLMRSVEGIAQAARRPTTSTCCGFTSTTTRRRSTKSCAASTTSFARARCITSARRTFPPGGWPGPTRWPTSTAGPRSSPRRSSTHHRAVVRAGVPAVRARDGHRPGLLVALGGGMCTGKYNRAGGRQSQLQRLVDEIDTGTSDHYWHDDDDAQPADHGRRRRRSPTRSAGTPAQVSLRWLMQQKVVYDPDLLGPHGRAGARKTWAPSTSR